MISKEKLKAIDLGKIQELDLDGDSRRSGWYAIKYDKTLMYQLCVRPDNRSALDYLENEGIGFEWDLINNEIFLLRTNAYIPISQSKGIVPNMFIPMIPAERPNPKDVTGIGILIAQYGAFVKQTGRANLRVVN